MDSPLKGMSRLQERMARPPESWVDVVMIAIIEDPLFYGILALVVFTVLALVALWATKSMLDSIAQEEKQRKKQEREGRMSRSSDKKSQ
ncbi:hypothetical protein Poli38472_008490 [Pythium oligandrum]|uniref:Uncharacterized protein n=1 Tax=Pythium oligandrum TaxID=41045 RepID=A0A8K1C487_PYTOL|nr:hypothetical protein Poli38472_008490 [Pythium oligandrum]|eukprot:TMW55842.1 hypothetical protein Poli38472_008490 [Pythium oligandrum]